MTEKKRIIAVFMGGISSEHDISLKSGSNVVDALAEGQYNVFPVIIGKNGSWHLPETAQKRGQAFDPDSLLARPALNAAWGLQGLIDFGIEAVFIALHGKGGEDGLMQGFLQTAGIPYTGSGVLGNALCMDKVLTKRILRQCGLPTANDIVIQTSGIAPDTLAAHVNDVEAAVGFPCVIKISDQGSSHFVKIIADRQEFIATLPDFKNAGKEVLVEELIRGREVTCAVIDSLEHGSCYALPPTELRPVDSSWFDYHAKYTPGATEEITPAPVDDSITAEIQRLASRCHQLLHCSGMSRTDMFLREDGQLVILEVNTIPGLTSTSLIPQAAAAVGISFRKLLELQIEWALHRHG